FGGLHRLGHGQQTPCSGCIKPKDASLPPAAHNAPGKVGGDVPRTLAQLVPGRDGLTGAFNFLAHEADDGLAYVLPDPLLSTGVHHVEASAGCADSNHPDLCRSGRTRSSVSGAHGLAVLLPRCRADVERCNYHLYVARFKISQQLAPVDVRRQVGDGRHKSGPHSRLQFCDELCEEAGLGAGAGGHDQPLIIQRTAAVTPAAGILCTATTCTGTPSTASVSPAV